MNCCEPRVVLFEHKMIEFLLRSKDYIGRGNINTNDPDKIIKNKNICNIIDKIRYGNNTKELILKLREKFKNRKLLIDGGNASSFYSFFEKLDLGNASSTLDDMCGEHGVSQCSDCHVLSVNYKNNTTGDTCPY